jgi:hypothetical protein
VVRKFDNVTLLVVTPTTNNQGTTYGTWIPNYYQQNSDLTVFIQNDAAPCGDIREGCVKKLNAPMVCEKWLIILQSLDEFTTPMKFSEPAEIVLHSFAIKFNNTLTNPPIVYVRLEIVALGSLAVAGAVILAIPALLICFPCIYVVVTIFK